MNPGRARRSFPTVTAGLLFALGAVGMPYVFGAKGPTAYDCSGLTQAAWAAADVGVSAGTLTQIHDGVPVSRLADLAPGDLLFTPGSLGTPSNPRHVGIYVGHGLLVDAHSSKVGVILERLDAWKNKIVAIRRVGGPGLAAGPLRSVVDQPVDGLLNLPGRALREPVVHGDDHARVLSHRLERGRQTHRLQRGRVDALREATHRAHDGPNLVAQTRGAAGRARVPGPHGLRRGQGEVEHRSQELGLHDVVEVTLDDATSLILGLDDSLARGPQLGELKAQLGLLALTVDRQSRCGTDQVDELTGVVAVSADLHRGERPALTHQGDRPRRCVHRPPVRVDKLLCLGQPVGDPDRGVPERACQRGLQRPKRW